MPEKLVLVLGDVFAGVTEWQVERAALALEGIASSCWLGLEGNPQRTEKMVAEVEAFERVAAALRKVADGIVAEKRQV